MSKWILSIVGMSFLGVVVETIIPNGKLNKFIKSMFSLFLLFVIISPLPKLFNRDISLSNNFDYKMDEILLVNINERKLNNYENAILNELKNRGIDNVSIQFEADTTKSNFKIQKIYIDVCNVVLKNNAKHINISDTIVEVITSVVEIGKEGVVIYGG